jgi:hypothetical protein
VTAPKLPRFLTEADRLYAAQLRKKLEGLSDEELAAQGQAAGAGLLEATTQYLAVSRLIVEFFRRDLAKAADTVATLRSLEAPLALQQARALQLVIDRVALRKGRDPSETMLLSLPDGSSGERIAEWVGSLVSTATGMDALTDSLDMIIERRGELHRAFKEISQALKSSGQPGLVAVAEGVTAYLGVSSSPLRPNKT